MHYKMLYGSVNNIDLWIGILAEDHLPGKSVGRTLNAMLKAQFENLRDGDFYFYLNDPYLPNTIREQIKHTKFSDIIKRNTGLSNIAVNAIPYRFMDEAGRNNDQKDNAGSCSKCTDIKYIQILFRIINDRYDRFRETECY